VKLKDIVLFARQLETMISAGLRLVDAIMTLSEQEVFSKNSEIYLEKSRRT